LIPIACSKSIATPIRGRDTLTPNHKLSMGDAT
jgi:hypothetical protein